MTDLTGARTTLKWADNQITILGAQITAHGTEYL
jgi:hypothetical protein